jgi:hypothetical protein
MAEAAGLFLRTVQRIWGAHELQPHRLRTFKRSSDPGFAAKLADVVGLFMRPPRHAVMLSIDEKSQIQALDRTQPGLPIKPDEWGTMTHDYKRNGTTILFAAPNVLDGTVPPPGIPALPERGRGGSPGRQAGPLHPGQLRHPQAPRGAGLGWRGTRAGPSTSPRPPAPG